MNRIATRASCYLALAFWLTACGSSPPSHFYRLTPGAGSIGSEQEPAIGVGPVEVPDFLKRSALVYSRGGNHLEMSDTELWAEPLAEGITRVLGLNLAQLLNTQNLTYFPWDPRHPPRFGVRVNVLDLDADEQEATLSADWLVYNPSDGAVIERRISQYKKTLSTTAFSPAALPSAYSTLFFQLAGSIADTIREAQKQAAIESQTTAP